MSLRTLREILKELRQASPNGPIRENLLVKYIFQQFRKYKMTEKQYCKSQEEMHSLAKTYLTYLGSSRRYTELQQEFHGKGERSTQETADLVGFKLPTDPK